MEIICKYHEKNMDLFCTTCRTPVCTSCITAYHNGGRHNFEDLGQRYERRCKQLDSQLQELTEAEREGARHMQTLERNLAGNKEAHQKIRESLELRCRSLVTAMELHTDR